MALMKRATLSIAALALAADDAVGGTRGMPGREFVPLLPRATG